MILAAMAGGVTGVAIFVAFDTGLVATPSPGSIFAYLAQTPRGASNWIGVYTGLLASTAVSFGVGAALLGFGRLAEPATDGDPEGAEEQDGTATAETAGDETAENETAKDEAAKSEAPKDAGDGAAKETTAH
ncbi:hypothetical protein [Actinomadura madurae]|nr:hypothetical protein [Actinomadura madurae]